ncbi:hypothetical protein BD408DRAFT_85164 [Parasitella parasitica]|nr:hypothetical protein BD408DRAFT_85164 [Parasitella parasitica]
MSRHATEVMKINLAAFFQEATSLLLFSSIIYNIVSSLFTINQIPQRLLQFQIESGNS